MNKKVRSLYSLLCVLFMTMTSGCANSRYACKGQPDGVVCADPVAVYHMTEETDEVMTATKGGKLTDKGEKKGKEVMNTIMRPPVDMAKPVLEPAQVLRIWVAPWVDDSQDLHGASYVFTEITPRRWTMGVYGAAVPHASHALQMSERPRRQDASGVPMVATKPLATLKKDEGKSQKHVEPVQPPMEDVVAR